MTNPAIQNTKEMPNGKMGLRERGKRERRRRIQMAARREFMEKGYDAATTRDIAALAEVGIGTLFTYAKDKRELLMMIVNDDLDDVSKVAEQAIEANKAFNKPLLEQVIAFYKPRYDYWAAHPALGRPIVREIMDVAGATDLPGPETVRFYARRRRMVTALQKIVMGCQLSGQATKAASARLIASLFLTIYLTEVRRWLNQETPDVNEGLARFRELVDLAIRGVRPDE
jgi:AcrR family transcriptional regulator